MTYTIHNAQWANEDKSSAVILSTEVGHVAISAVDTPVEWEAFLAWAASNMVIDLPLPLPRPTKEQRFDCWLAGMGMTVADFKALLG